MIWDGKGYNNEGKYEFEIKEGKSYVKEYYDNGNIEFEGEYLDGKRNGKGKEYNYLYHFINFEGEYLNGKRNGKGKEYNKNGKLLFEGDYLNGKQWNGILREYFYNGKLKFEKELINGRFSGICNKYSENQD